MTVTEPRNTSDLVIVTVPLYQGQTLTEFSEYGKTLSVGIQSRRGEFDVTLEVNRDVAEYLIEYYGAQEGTILDLKLLEKFETW